ncbi:MAG TPA: hypothetical protein DDW65_11955, partial [Firmicutes bacterium]|nr:hypothetical protein [Bacillota bacterium]
MKSLLRHLGTLFLKIAKAAGLVRLKVFYQLLIVIGVMIVFLGFQAFSNDQIIITMQKTNQSVFADNAARSADVSQMKQDIAKLQTAYLLEVGDDSVGYSVTSIADRLTPFKWADKESQKNISDDLVLIQKLLNDTPTRVNFEQLRDIILQLSIQIGKIETNLNSSTMESLMKNDYFLRQSRAMGIIILTISALFSLLLGVVIVNSIAIPLKQVETAAKLVAVGDLSHNITAIGSPEILGVVAGLNQAINGLRELVSNINSQSEILFKASQELKSASSETGHSAAEVAKA